MVRGDRNHSKGEDRNQGKWVETLLETNDLELLKATIPAYSKTTLSDSLENAVFLYRKLRDELFTTEVILNNRTEESVMNYFADMKAAG